ncbi:MAG TPA: 2-C-methyl-D-erythritol 4-phosphate cytidylyltransferase [Phycisphaerales bacterium]|nr:2-C-methyl-D-erythritol 4-phosphate cytidylyltransferase [Phycisphaerales bacterium]
MSTPFRVCVIIPAAGRSTRFGEADKLIQDLGGRPLLMRTVELFAKRDEVTSIIVAGPPDEFDLFRERYAATIGFHGGKVVPGGKAERWETVKNALAAVPEDATHIAVHDAARPGAPREMLDRIFRAAATLPAVIPALPINATIKRLSVAQTNVDDDENAIADSILGEDRAAALTSRTVEATIDRANLFEIQTPQIFRADLLRRAYAQPNLASLKVTDDASLIESIGQTVHAVEGDSRNFKITTPADLRLMRAVLGVQPPSERPAHMRF